MPAPPIADAFRQPHGGSAERLTQSRRQAGGGRFFPDFLPPALERTFALVEMDRVLAVAEHLNFDMPRAGDVALEIEAAIAECGARFGGCLRNLLAKLFRRLGDTNAAPAAPRRGLDHQRIAEASAGFDRRIDPLDPSFRAGDDADIRARRHLARRGFVAHGADRFRFRADEDQPRRLDHLSEIRVLGEEAVARMNGVGAARHGGRDDRIFVEIGFAGVRPALSQPSHPPAGRPACPCPRRLRPVRS